MSLIFLDGCGEYYASADLHRVWSTVDFGSGSPLIVQPTGGRLGNANILFGNSGQRLGLGFTPTQTLFVGWALKMAALPVGDITLCNVYGPDDVIHGFIRITTTGSIEYVRGSTVLANTAAGIIQAAAFHYIEFQVTISDTVGVVVLRVDNTELDNQTGLDTKNGGTGELTNGINFEGLNHQIDDVYILDDSGLAPFNGFLSDVRIEKLLPNATGNSQQFDVATPSVNHWENVDEATPDGDTSYNETATPNDVDLFNYGNLPVVVGGASVLGVKVASLVNKQDAGDAPFQLLTRPTSTTFNGAITQQPSTDYHYKFEIWQTNPQTSVLWLESEVDAAQFGIESL